MPIHHARHHYDESPDADDSIIECTRCKTSKHLLVESIEPLEPQVDGWVAVEYSCGKCEAFFAHTASVQRVAQLLITRDGHSGVWKFGRYFIHCGAPMEEAPIRLSGLDVDDEDLRSVPTVHLPSMVLHCRCGFQMCVPG